MKSVGCCETLQVSPPLEAALRAIGETESFRVHDLLFRSGDLCAGVFLVSKGEVCLEVPETPLLDRVFLSASLLGLPATFTGHPYTLNATCRTDCEVVHVKRDKFLDLMSTRVDFCQQAIELLSREVTFILVAYRKNPRRAALEKHPGAQKPRTVAHAAERLRERPEAFEIPIACPICWDQNIEKLEGVALSASTTGGRSVGGALVYRCRHWHLFALFRQQLTADVVRHR
jgi:CRP-like cAMP-binding protein